MEYVFEKNNVTSQFVKKVVKICLVIQKLDIFIYKYSNEKMVAVFIMEHVLFRLAQPFTTCGHDEKPKAGTSQERNLHD